MLTLTADQAMASLLRQAKDLAEIRDDGGKVIGFFAPISVEKAHLYAGAAARIDPVEIERRKAEKGQDRTTKEVFEHLKSLTPDPEMKAYLQGKIERVMARDECRSR
jgi:hypothetical protein